MCMRSQNIIPKISLLTIFKHLFCFIYFIVRLRSSISSFTFCFLLEFGNIRISPLKTLLGCVLTSSIISTIWPLFKTHTLTVSHVYSHPESIRDFQRAFVTRCLSLVIRRPRLWKCVKCEKWLRFDRFFKIPSVVVVILWFGDPRGKESSHKSLYEWDFEITNRVFFLLNF